MENENLKKGLFKISSKKFWREKYFGKSWNPYFWTSSESEFPQKTTLMCFVKYKGREEEMVKNPTWTKF